EQARELADAEQARELAEAEAALERAWLAKQQARPERPLRFRVQFTAEQEYVDLLEEAFDLLEIGRASCRERVEMPRGAVSSRRRHTRFSRDWSSDVCSSDLNRHGSSRMQNRHGSSLRRRPRSSAPGWRSSRRARSGPCGFAYSSPRSRSTSTYWRRPSICS